MHGHASCARGVLPDGAFPLQISHLGTSPEGRFVAIAQPREPPYVLGVPPPASPAGKRLPCRLGGTSGRRCFPRDGALFFAVLRERARRGCMAATGREFTLGTRVRMGTKKMNSDVAAEICAVHAMPVRRGDPHLCYDLTQ